MALDPLMIPAASLARPTTMFATPATITVRRVALCPLPLFTEVLLARARDIKPAAAPRLGRGIGCIGQQQARYAGRCSQDRDLHQESTSGTFQLPAARLDTRTRQRGRAWQMRRWTRSGATSWTAAMTTCGGC